MRMLEAVRHGELEQHCLHRSVLSADNEFENAVHAKLTALRDSPTEFAAAELTASVVDRESRLGLPEWGALFDSLLTGDDQDVGDRVRKWGHNHVLRANTCDGSGHNLGRIVIQEDFLRVLGRSGVAQWVIDSALLQLQGANWEEGIKSLQEAADLIGRSMNGVEIARWVMWSTFDLVSDDPFSGIRDADLAATLGLEDLIGRSIYVLHYSLPDSVSPHYPTVAEAAASAVWNRFFSPSDELDTVGFTVPIEGNGFSKRPEIVHAVLEVGCLNGPVRKVGPKVQPLW